MVIPPKHKVQKPLQECEMYEIPCGQSCESSQLKQKSFTKVMFALEFGRKRGYESYMIIPSFVLIVDDGSSQASCGVNTGAGDGDGGKVDQEHGETDGKGCQELQNAKEKNI